MSLVKATTTHAFKDTSISYGAHIVTRYKNVKSNAKLVSAHASRKKEILLKRRPY